MSIHRVKLLRSSYLTGVLPTSTETSTDHVFRDKAVKGRAAVAFLCGDDGELDSAEGGGDLASVGTRISPPRHATQSALRYGGALTGQESDGDVAVQIDRRLQLERRWAV